MKITDYQPNKPLILGNLGEEPKTLPKLTEEQILALQPPSTQRVLKMNEWQLESYQNREWPDESQWRAPEIEIEPILDENGNLDSIKVGDRVIQKEMINLHKSAAREKLLKSYYKKDLTALIDARNKDGVIEDEKLQMPFYRKWMAEKIAKPDHPFLVEAKTPKTKWQTVGPFRAFIAWLLGKQVRHTDD